MKISDSRLDLFLHFLLKKTTIDLQLVDDHYDNSNTVQFEGFWREVAVFGEAYFSVIRYTESSRDPYFSYKVTEVDDKEIANFCLMLGDEVIELTALQREKVKRLLINCAN